MARVSEDEKAERKARDIRIIQRDDLWPLGYYLPMKTQPWLNNGRNTRTGKIDLDDILTVIPNGGGPAEKFASLEELTEVWSVD
jgi:hypothetical protein